MRNKTVRKKLMAGAIALTMATATLAPMQIVCADEITATNISFDTARDLTFNSANAEEMSGSDNFRYYKFSVDQASELNVGLDIDVSYNEYPEFTIYDANRTSVYGTSFGHGSHTTGSIYLTGGSYYLKIRCNGKISFTATIASLNESFTETQTANNDNHDNANGINLATKYKGVLAQNDEKDYYKFELPAAGKLNVNVSNATNADIKAVIYDDSNAMVYNKSLSSGSKVDEDVTLASGTYYLMVAQQEVGKGTGSYEFNLDFVMSAPTITGLKNSGKKKMTVQYLQLTKKEKY